MIHYEYDRQMCALRTPYALRQSDTIQMMWYINWLSVLIVLCHDIIIIITVDFNIGNIVIILLATFWNENKIIMMIMQKCFFGCAQH